MPRQIQGSQWNFSFGEVDVELKRADDHPARKGGLRQMANARILNSGSMKDRPGRTAVFVTGTFPRNEKVRMSSGNIFTLSFGVSGGTGAIQVRDSTGAVVATFTGYAWTLLNLNNIVWANQKLAIYITFSGQQPQILSWDGVATWSITPYVETLATNQKRTPFYRIAPPGITMLPSGVAGAITVHLSQPYFKIGHVGTRMRFCNRQITITSIIDSQNANALVNETLPGSQVVDFLTDPSVVFSVGDVVVGSITGAKGVVSLVNAGAGGNIHVQLLGIPQVPGTALQNIVAGLQPPSVAQTLSFIAVEIIVGPGGSLADQAGGGVVNPEAVEIWDEQIMDAYHGWPASCFADQNRVGFCDFPSLPNGIAWSSINSATDLFPGANPSDAMFELVPNKGRVRYVVAGPESSEFVFCDNGLYYIPISTTNPLKPGSVGFNLLSGDGAARVQPRIAQEAILYVNAGQNTVMAVIATGAYLRPFNTKNLCEFHSHLFNNIQCLAFPTADGTFNERYAYVLNGDGSIAVGKYDANTLASATVPTVGWGPWSGAGVVSWISAQSADVIFTTSYFGVGVCEVLDDSQYLDCALPVNALPAAFAPPGGKGPLWFIPNQSVTLIDQVTRVMGTYQIDGNGFIVPQNNGGENLNIGSLVAGQPWTMIAEPFAPDATPGADMGQRMKLRQISNVAAYVIHSSGLLIAQLFSAMQTATSPPLGTVMSQRRFTPWNMGDDATKPPTLRETVLTWTPPGASYDPRVAFIKDTPGPLTICEIAMEITL
ncbi:hypothetical protein [Bradyrhizobium lablabi]|uniref:Uncharacterized protein n=1 Tax=Bradyrhizobium lablabi TaxID=722472 RepID=A0A1H5JHD8_9BRAD|nr:hypothetical protein [Bradyrhizobium lablabi]SEE51983.1 hypothetical protein SAMN05444171_7831 [Bradyrhizobium lablabi]